MRLLATFPKEIPQTRREIGAAIMGEEDVCCFLGKHIEAILSEGDFEQMYAETGRPGIHPVLLTIVTVLQYLEKLPDWQASGQVV